MRQLLMLPVHDTRHWHWRHISHTNSQQWRWWWWRWRCWWPMRCYNWTISSWHTHAQAHSASYPLWRTCMSYCGVCVGGSTRNCKLRLL